MIIVETQAQVNEITLSNLIFTLLCMEQTPRSTIWWRKRWAVQGLRSGWGCCGWTSGCYIARWPLEGRVVFRSLFFKETVFQVANLKICPSSLDYVWLSACVLFTILCGHELGSSLSGDGTHVSLNLLLLMAYSTCLTSQFIYSVGGMWGCVNILLYKWLKNENTEPVIWALLVLVYLYSWLKSLAALWANDSLFWR